MKFGNNPQTQLVYEAGARAHPPALRLHSPGNCPHWSTIYDGMPTMCRELSFPFNLHNIPQLVDEETEAQ